MPERVPLSAVQPARAPLVPCRALALLVQSRASPHSLRRLLLGCCVRPGLWLTRHGAQILAVHPADQGPGAANDVLVTAETDITFVSQRALPPESAPLQLLPGLETELRDLVELIRLPLLHADAFSRLAMQVCIRI